MWRTIASISLVLAIYAPTSAGTMRAERNCRVVDGAKWLAGSGGANALCEEIQRAVSAVAPKTRYTADVRALSASRFSATLVVNGQKLPEQHFAVMDRQIDAGSIRQFAEALAEQVATAAKR